MHGTSDAFVFVPVKCPICSRDSRQRYVKSKLYTPKEVEGDQHVVSYTWESPQYEGIRPAFYHIWHCPHCHFCDEKEVFRGEDACGGKLEMIREKILIATKAPRSLVNRLGRVIEVTDEQLPLETALCIHLLGIHLQELLSTNMRQYGKLARLYLRTAWLYREKQAWNLPERQVPAGFASYGGFLESLRTEWPEIPLAEEKAIEIAIASYQHELEHSKRIDDIRFELNTLFLLADLQQRRGHLEEALTCVRHIFQQATRRRQNARQALDTAVSQGKGTQQQIESLRSLVSWLTNAIERDTTLAEGLNNRIFEQEYPRAREAVLQLGAVTADEVSKRLHELKYHEITCRRITAMFGQKNLQQSLGEAQKAEASVAAPERKDRGFWGSVLKSIIGNTEESP